MPPDEARVSVVLKSLSVLPIICPLVKTIAPFRKAATPFVIEVALVVDSYLYAYAGGKAMLMRSPSIIATTSSQFYEVPGLCKLEISSLEIHCNPDTDPIRPLLRRRYQCLLRFNGLLQNFVEYISSTASMPMSCISLRQGLHWNFHSWVRLRWRSLQHEWLQCRSTRLAFPVVSHRRASLWLMRLATSAVPTCIASTDVMFDIFVVRAAVGLVKPRRIHQ
jgi:hypothetical protein